MADPHPQSSSIADAQAHTPRWWWVELWFESRQLFKEMVKHVIFFSVLVGVLEGFHRLLSVSTLPADELSLLNTVHFYMYVVLLVIFAGSFIIKMLVTEWRGIGSRRNKRDSQSTSSGI